ncbi:glycogen debranching protein GlgX [Pasteurella atlantica]|uniref:glycogen debranching protein GlgX n=1 Tax=Pasteurellaceae TaxID=712 RepID=UPI00276B4D50|nr:glycogen debranching protein GlgX [Pasteurella atlantica]MDP8033785.1 glycogen debranching protein GlgX [Pasteurella atlantica]MDP8035720.1 glycogen debranching protein GlgX [Pasteurella atlantica]MDP8037599.1 glycogen debranching protein GlgX [Pasteurella atlantica]MDP8048020.1 glycogen debranching protein GlgX [Pasteurella atlantica]MDP8049975.1 glycogen debranching protein GlgX [Pasteurella atlantica]
MNKINKGKPYPLGCTKQIQENIDGFNFAIFSSKATAIELCIFEDDEETRYLMHQSEDIWHIWLSNVSCGMKYGYRLYGDGLNPNKLILDPYAKEVVGKPDLSNAEKRSWFLLNDPRDNAHLAPKAVIFEDKFAWQDDQSPNIAWADTIIYEANVKGLTKLREDLPENIRGTYVGVAHSKMIAYLKELGITTLELLPVNYHLDEPHLQEKGLHNYWGYNPLAMFTVEPKYWSGRKGTSPLSEFKEMVKALHKAGIEVVLDVVFNHSAESEKDFPTFCQRGIDDETYYWRNDQGEYINATGCGNMLNVSSEIGRRWVIDCLRYWVEECHVDGFRFDLAPTLGRETPAFNPKAKLFEEIAEIPSLQKCKFIAEPWDIGEGGYQVGNFPVYFSEWNDRFRDDMCRFWLWKSGELGAFAQRFSGSSDIYQREGYLPHNSINFITAHDGFTLKDLTCYNQKHNLANGENNNDGRNENYSYNHGIEGLDDIPEAVKLDRFFTSCGLLCSLLLANGVPMLLAGDEFGNSQYGNNNAYCQDNQTAWLKWNTFEKELFDVTKKIIAIRKQILSLSKDKWWNENNVSWLNVNGQPMREADWHNNETEAFQILLDNQWLLLVNAKSQPQTFLLSKEKWETVYSNTDVILQEDVLKVDNLTFCILQK